MATGATIYKAELQIADIDRHYYQNHSLTLARHPSETDERLMVRVLAFVLYADDALQFGRGLSAQDEPDLWRKDLTGATDLWIDIGHPDERDVRRACSRARQAVIIGYSGRATELWWSQQRATLERLQNLTILTLPTVAVQSLARLARRTMHLQCNVQEGQVSIIRDADLVQIDPIPLLKPETNPLAVGKHKNR